MTWTSLYHAALAAGAASGRQRESFGTDPYTEACNELAAWLRRGFEVRAGSAAEGGRSDSRRAAGGRQTVGRALVERARAGDAEAFATLFAEFGDDVERVSRRILGGPDAAREAQSEVFLRARRAFATYDPERPLRPWLLAIASHCCIDQLRRSATERRLFSEDAFDEEISGEADASPLARVVAVREREAVSRAIEALPERYRLPLVLRYFAERDYAEIAEALGVSRGQVGSLLFRARKLLRAALAGGEADAQQDAPEHAPKDAPEEPR